MSISAWNERWLAVLAMIWGITLMIPGDLFQGITAYRLFSQYAPDTVWGIVLFLLGISLFLPTPMWVHKHAHWLLCTIWMGMGILCLLGRFSPAVVLLSSVCLTVSMLHVGKFWRLNHPARIYP
jgi:hypothetical protein